MERIPRELVFAIPVALAMAATFYASKQRRLTKTISKSLNQRIPQAFKEEIIEAPSDTFEVFVAPNDKFKFNAAHFIAYKGFRERLHGHNYSVAVSLLGKGRLGHDGYLVDFGDVKDVVTQLCKELNEHFLLPCQSDVLEISLTGTECCLTCEDGVRFVLPENDVVKLPIVHSSAEELSRYLWTRIVESFGREALEARNVIAVQVSVAEMPNQQATFRRYLKDTTVLKPVAAPKDGCSV